MLKKLNSFKSSNRLLFLDSIRGLAALQVLIFHVNNAVLGDNEFYGRVLINGISPVSLFFVLSGYVLTKPFIERGEKINILKFTIKRIFRIYPLYIVLVIVLSLIENYEPFFVIKECSLLFSDNKIIFPSWTLTIELLGSIYIISLTFFFTKKKYLICLIFILIIPFLTFYDIHKYLPNFVLGMLLNLALKYKFKLANNKIFFFTIIGYVLIGLINIKNLNNLDDIELLSPFIYSISEKTQPFLYLISGVFSFYIIYFIILKSHISIWLEKPILIFLGKISFGLYLSHFPILFFLTPFLNNFNAITGSTWLTHFLLILLVITISVIISYILYKFIELPFIKFGKNLIVNKNAITKN